ncbi:MAG: peptidase MA family metallohydrolase [Polyangiales bacterium]
MKIRPHLASFAAFLCAIAITSVSIDAVAQFAPQEAQTLSLPSPLDGYETKQVGAVTWTFPESERGRVSGLIDGVEEHWAELADNFGVPIDDQLIIRVARNPREMKTMAPYGYPPPDYATGVAYSHWGVILLTMSAPETWQPPDLEVVLVHELSHVALYRAVLGNSVPRWFNEGVAIHQSEVRLLPRMESLLRAAAQRSMLRLSELDDRFPNRPHEVNVAYAQSADVVGFLRRTDNDERRFHRMMQSLREGETFDTALASAYGWTRIGLERQWRESLRTRYRILPALFAGSTIWVAAAILVVFAYRRRRRYHHTKLQQMAYREELEALRLTSEPPPAAIAPTDMAADTGGIPIVEHDGESHTLH